MKTGFILQPTYRIEAGRPVVLLHGVLREGGTFLVRDTRARPYFWVAADEAHRATALGATIAEHGEGRQTLAGEPVARIEFVLPREATALRDGLRDQGATVHEADVRFAYRYLIDRGIRGSLEIRGESHPGIGETHVFDNPDVAPADWTPQLSVLSIDIETDPRAQQLLSVALCGCGTEEVLLWHPDDRECPPGATPFATQQELLRAFVHRVQEIDPDILTGWNFIDFDLTVLQRMAQRAVVPLALGRGPEVLRLLPARQSRGMTHAIVPGRVVLDGIQLLRGAFIRVESYGLNAVSHAIVGKRKTIQGKDRAEEILRQFEEELPSFVEYNLNDARLVLEILDELKLIELTVERSRLTGMPPDRVSASIASFDFLYLTELGRRERVAPSVADSMALEEPTAGGHVLEPETGLFRNVLIFDFKSLYPSLIRTFEIDPLGHIPCPGPDDDPIVAPNGAAFRREPGILPALLDDLVPRRERAKRENDSVTSQAIKILMNSFYGVLGTPACRFYDPALANAITGFGREILLWTKARIEQHGYRVLSGDTDSLFVEAGVEDAHEARALGERLVVTLNDDLRGHVRRMWRVESKLELEFERLYLRLLLPAVRHGTGGARKRYAGLVEEGEGTRVSFTGMEVVRRDWTELAKRVQRELYGRLFRDRPVDDYLRGVVEDVRAGRLDDLLVYRKSLRKKLESYTASTPPHVAAARKLGGRPPRTISYLITVDGAEPVEKLCNEIDREHYVQKQVRPVSEPVLAVLGLEFDQVVGDEHQLRLF
ncbi:MAG: DNA polymerase II [bacterium]|nr:DNA polymerase II [bacterium]